MLMKEHAKFIYVACSWIENLIRVSGSIRKKVSLAWLW